MNLQAELLDELRLRVAHLEGELASAQAEVAALAAADQQARVELEAARAEAAAATERAALVQRHADEQAEAFRNKLADLEERLAEARRLEQIAESERSAVIAALGRKARRHLALDDA